MRLFERGALGRPPLPGGDTGATPAPVDFPSELTVVVAMAAADNHAAAVAQDGSLYTWGNADFGKLGVARTGVVRTPTRAGSAGGLAALTEGLAATGVACSAYSTVALYSDGSLWSFGGAPASVADVAAAAQQKDGPTWRRALAAVKAQLARPVPLAEGLVARAVFGGGYHHVALGGPPDAGMPRFEKEHLEELRRRCAARWAPSSRGCSSTTAAARRRRSCATSCGCSASSSPPRPTSSRRSRSCAGRRRRATRGPRGR